MQSKLIPAAVLLFLLALLQGCAARGSGGDRTPALLTSLQATTVADSAYFLLQVTNTDSVPVALEFATEPTFYFLVRRGDLLLWNSAPELSPLGGVTIDTLRAGATRSFQASWTLPIGLRGTLTVTGVVHDRRQPLVQSTEVRVP